MPEMHPRRCANADIADTQQNAALQVSHLRRRDLVWIDINFIQDLRKIKRAGQLPIPAGRGVCANAGLAVITSKRILSMSATSQASHG
jgi:hypothetical protein